MYWKIKINHVTTTEKGTNKTITENWLCLAWSATEAIAKAGAKIDEIKLSDGIILSVNILPFQELFGPLEGKRYSAGVTFIMFDEQKGVERRQKNLFLVTAENYDDAKKCIEEGMKETAAQWEISELKESNITEII
jgi:hypothetical protein